MKYAVSASVIKVLMEYRELNNELLKTRLKLETASDYQLRSLNREMDNIQRKINSNLDAVKNAMNDFNDALGAVQTKRHKARTIDVDDVIRAINAAEKHLFEISTVTDAVGTIINVDVNAQSFPNAYKGIPESTKFDAKLTSSGLAVVGFYREKCNNAYDRILFGFTEKTIANMPKKLGRIYAF